MLRYLDAGLTVLTHPPTSDPHFVDWYDYSERIAAASADATAAAAVDGVGPTGAIWLVTAGGYRGFEASCDSLAATLRHGRKAERVVAARPVYEHMVLVRLAAAEP